MSLRFSSRNGFTTVLLAAALLTGCGSDKTDTQGTGGTAQSMGGAGGVGGAGGAPATGGLFGESSGGAPAQCHNVAESCESSLECCAGMTCNNTSGVLELNGCQKRCAQPTDCESGCCFLFEGANTGICADKKWCACGTTDATCGSTNPPCCSDQTCLAADQARTKFACKKLCQNNSDCPTNCCVAIPNLDKKACLDPVYCGVAP